jgi:peptidoglycan/xylan/chitin deacetylase (PgdA/CDA1 family)
MWNVSSEDWKRSPEEIVALVIARTQPGAIILLHDGVPPNETTDRISTLQALPEILYKLSPRYRFCTVDELARQASL